MRRPSSRISPEAMRPGGSSRPMMALPVSDLPAPDSPTTPKTSPGAMSNDTSSTASKVPRRVGNSTRRFFTSRSGGLLEVVIGSFGPRASRALLSLRARDPSASSGQAARGPERYERTSSQLRVQRVAQPVAQKVHRQNQGGERDAGEHGDPPVARLQHLVAEANQRAERGLGRRQADAQERQRRLGDDGEAEIDG